MSVTSGSCRRQATYACVSVTSGSGWRQAIYACVSVTSGSGWQQATYARASVTGNVAMADAKPHAHVSLSPEVWVWLTPSHIRTCLCHREFRCGWRQAAYARVSSPGVWQWLTPSHIRTCLCHRECGNGWPSTRRACSSLPRSCAWWSLFSCGLSQTSRTCS